MVDECPARMNDVSEGEGGKLPPLPSVPCVAPSIEPVGASLSGFDSLLDPKNLVRVGLAEDEPAPAFELKGKRISYSVGTESSGTGAGAAYEAEDIEP